MHTISDGQLHIVEISLAGKTKTPFRCDFLRSRAKPKTSAIFNFVKKNSARARNSKPLNLLKQNTMSE